MKSVSLPDAGHVIGGRNFLIEGASRTPERVIGVDDRKGSLTLGKDADLLILDEELRV